MSAVATVDEIEVVTTRPAPETKGKRKKQPQYVVIVENDDHHTFLYVIEVLQKVCGHTLEEAERLAGEVHHTGKAVVWQGSYEVAELKRDQIRGYGPDLYAHAPVTFPLGCYIGPMSG
jgi:ATP-dependent Clp protease adaptor protein ClpS